MIGQEIATVVLDTVEKIVEMLSQASAAEAFGMGLKIGLFKLGIQLPVILASIGTLVFVLWFLFKAVKEL